MWRGFFGKPGATARRRLWLMYHFVFALLLVHFILVHAHPTYVHELQATWSDGFSFIREEPPALARVIEKDGRRLLWGGERGDQHFDVTECRLKINHLHFGLGREAFSALLQPEFGSVEQAEQWMDPRDRVLAVRVGDTVRVYPISLLTHHEVVNDVVDGVPIFAAYCILADLGAVYDRRLGERVLTFGVSGYTYYDPKVWDGKDAFVLWDRETESLWWPPIGKAVSGALIDRQLKLLDQSLWSQTSWEKVRAQYPQAQVLRPGQDFERPATWTKLDATELARSGATEGEVQIAPRWGAAAEFDAR